MLPKPLPDHLAFRPFRVQDAADAGVSRNRLRASDLARPFSGTRVPVSLPMDLEGLSRALATRMPPDAFFCGPTAALLLGMPLPEHLERDPRLHVGVPDPARAPHAASIVGHRYRIRSDDLFDVADGVRITTPERTWCDLAALVPTIGLVVAGDYLIHWRRRLTTRQRLADALTEYPGRRGLRSLREALSLLHERSESPKESELRVILVRAGLPTPLVNEPIYDARGRFIARPDLRFPDCRMILEYEGDGHRTDRRQWRRDLTRVSELEAERWYVMRVTQADLVRPHDAFIRRVIRNRRRLGAP